jgi:hypothetical protein
MTSQPVEDVCAVIWHNYMLVNDGGSEGDDRRNALYRFIRDLNACPEYDFDILQVAGAVYLKKLDEFGEDRDARRAGAEAAARSLKSRIGQADP